MKQAPVIVTVCLSDPASEIRRDLTFGLMPHKEASVQIFSLTSLGEYLKHYESVLWVLRSDFWSKRSI